jgi:hypothetical protein
MERSLGRRYEGEQQACHIQGWRRTWNSIYPNQRYYFIDEDAERCYPNNILYLNVTPANDLLNGILYVIRAEDVAGYDKREAVYERSDVRDAITDIEVTGGPVWMYVGLPAYVLNGPVPRKEAAVRRTYVKIIDDALDHLGPAFREEYLQSSDPVPHNNIMDDIFEE